MAALSGVAYASMARSIGHNRDARLVIGTKLRLAIAVSATGLVVGFLILATSIVGHYFSRYDDAKAVLTPFAFLLPAVGINGLCVATLSARGKFTTLCKLAAFNLVVFAVALFALIPVGGASGAATGLLIGETCSLCVLIWLVGPTISLDSKLFPR